MFYRSDSRIIKGFSLLEVMFSIALISIIFVSLIQILIAGHFAIQQGNEIVTASNMAQEILEKSRQLGFDKIPLQATCDGFKNTGSVTGFPSFPPVPYPSITDSGNVYYAKVKVSGLSGTSNEVKKIEVEIFWDGKSPFHYQQGGGNSKIRRNLVMSTIVSKAY